MTYSKFSLAKLPTIFLRVLVLLATAQITAISVTALNSPVQNSLPAATDNPLLTESALPYHTPPFDKIKDEHFVPAIEAGMQEQLKEVDAIAVSPDKPTFDNTLVALERTGQLLDRAERTFSNLNAADTNPTRQKIEIEIAPKLAAHRDEIHLNPKLFARIQELYSPTGPLSLTYQFQRRDGQWRKHCVAWPRNMAIAYANFRYPLQRLQGTFDHTLTSDQSETIKVDLVGYTGATIPTSTSVPTMIRTICQRNPLPSTPITRRGGRAWMSRA